MEFAEIQAEVARLSEAQQRKLAAYLTKLRVQRHPEVRAEWARRLDDGPGVQWVGLKEAKELLGD